MLTPEQIEHQEIQLNQLPTIKALKEADETLYRELKTLEQGQKSLEDKVDTGFEKGKERMDGMESKIDNLFNLFTSHTQRTEQMHQETKDALKDHKYQDLKEEKKALQAQIDDAKKRKWDIAKGLGLLIAGAIISGISITFFK